MLFVSVFNLKHIIHESFQFEKMKSGLPGLFTAYHWCETIEDANDLIKLYEKRKLSNVVTKKVFSPGFFITDSPMDWSVGCQAQLVLSVMVNNPFMKLKDDKSFEERMGPSNKWINLLKSQGYDSAGNVPKNEIIGTRQMLLFDPNNQILSMKIGIIKKPFESKE